MSFCRATGDGATHPARHHHTPLEHTERHFLISELDIVRRCGVDLKDLPAAARSASGRSLTPTPELDAPTTRRRPTEKDQQTELPGLTSPTPSGMTCGEPGDIGPPVGGGGDVASAPAR